MPVSSEILGQYETNKTAATSGVSNKLTADKDTFMKLLIAQMTHQDPLNPVEDKEFISQMAQFTSVEELMNINTNLQSLSQTVTQQQVSNAVSLMGTSVVATGDIVTLVNNADKEGNTYCSQLFADIPTNLSACTVNVYATDSKGNVGALVYSNSLGAVAAGEQSFTWSGKDNNGASMGNGSYIVTFSGVDANGRKALVTTRSAGVVVGVETQENGNHKLYLNDGRTVNYNNVETITYTPSNDSNEDDKNKTTDES